MPATDKADKTQNGLAGEPQLGFGGLAVHILCKTRRINRIGHDRDLMRGNTCAADFIRQYMAYGENEVGALPDEALEAARQSLETNSSIRPPLSRQRRVHFEKKPYARSSLEPNTSQEVQVVAFV